MLTAKDAAGRTTTMGGYDPLNNPGTITDPAGNTSTFQYDGNGNLLGSSVPVAVVGGATTGTAVTTFERSDVAHPEDVTAVIGPDQQGLASPKKTVFTYRASDGQVAWVQDPEGTYVTAGQKPGYRTTFGYDARGFLTSTVTPRGNGTATPTDDYQTTFTVNGFGMVQSTTDPLGATASTLYDGNGNVVSSTDANVQTTTTEYDEMNRPTIVHRPDGSETTTTYFPSGAVSAQVNGRGDATTYAYDDHGAVISSTDANGAVTAYRYDDLGRLGERVDPGGSCPSAGCTTYAYDGGNQLIGVDHSDPVTPDITGVTYDALGQRSTVTRSAGAPQSWAWDSWGQLRSTTDANGRTTAFTWTLAGQLDTILYPGQANPVDYAYDAAGRMTSVTDWASRATTFEWTRDSQWRTTTFPNSGNNDIRGWDEAGRLSSVQWRKGATVLGRVDYDRDPEGLIESETPTGGSFSTRTWGYDEVDQLDTVDSTLLDLDDAGNLVRTDDGTYQVFDPAQQLCWTSPTAAGDCSTPAADATVFGYDDRGNRTSMAAPGPEPTTGYTYDQENRLTGVDQVGAAPLTDVAGTPVPGDYDADGADDVMWYQAGTGADWATWGGDRTDFGRRATSYAVDGTYRPIGGDFDGDGHGDIFWYAVGATSDPIWFWFGDSTGDYVERSFTFTLDRTPLVGDFDADGFDDVFFYGVSGNSDLIWFGNTDVDTTSSFTSLASSMGGTTYVPATGDFDGDGHSDILWYRPGADSDLVWFGTATRGTWVSEPTPISGTYTPVAGDLDGDGKDDLVLHGATGSDAIWWGGTRTAFGASATASLTIADGLVLATGDFDGDGPEDLLLHDPAGTTDDMWWGTTTRSALGTSGHTGLPANAATVADYAYDADGLRNAKTVDGTTTEFTWNTAGGLPLLLSQHQGSATTYLVYGPGGTPLYEVSASGISFYHQDHQGSTRLLTSTAGVVTAAYAYDAYGELTTNTHPSGATPLLGYTGQYTDAETGFIYLRARYMDPKTGQFLTKDPIAGLTRSPYAYADGDPINRTDPRGMAAALAGIAAAVAEAAAAAAIVVGAAIYLFQVWVLTSVAREGFDRVTELFNEEADSGDFLGDCVDEVQDKIEIANDISSGHSWDDHGVDDPFVAGQGEWADIVQDTLLNPDAEKQSGHADGRKAYWNDAEGLIVIIDPQNPDHGTAYRPDAGKDAFDEWE